MSRVTGESGGDGRGSRGRTHPILYASLAVSLLLLVLFSMGEVIWPAAPVGEKHWTETLFFGVCHQIPSRTFQVDGRFMAVNTRCFGIFAALFVSWLIMPFVQRFSGEGAWPGVLLLVAVMIQIIDYSGNLMQLWVNTNFSRFWTGALLGGAVPIYLADLFFPPGRE
ncbi:MAG: hypothetical protein DA443_04620 [Bacteroidetes bacterium]|nr:MAG: hypothetical protein DA443_04620 [Bacteroidota bacterium]